MSLNHPQGVGTVSLFYTFEDAPSRNVIEVQTVQLLISHVLG